MTTKQNCGAHSAQVEMRLIVNGIYISISQMGRDFVIVESPADYPPGKASLLLKVDESESRWDVHLPNGISVGSRRVAIAAIQ